MPTARLAAEIQQVRVECETRNRLHSFWHEAPPPFLTHLQAERGRCAAWTASAPPPPAAHAPWALFAVKVADVRYRIRGNGRTTGQTHSSSLIDLTSLHGLAVHVHLKRELVKCDLGFSRRILHDTIVPESSRSVSERSPLPLSEGASPFRPTRRPPSRHAQAVASGVPLRLSPAHALTRHYRLPRSHLRDVRGHLQFLFVLEAKSTREAQGPCCR